MNAKDFRAPFGVTLRRQRLTFAAWIGSLCLVLVVVPNACWNDLGSMGLRRSVTEMMNSSATTHFPFGTVSQSGTIGRLIQWETGVFLLIFTAITVILIVTTVGRRGGDDGLHELVEGTEVGRTVVFVVQAVVETVFSLAASFGCSFVLAIQTPLFSEISVAGSMCLGVSITLAGCAFSTIGLIASQLTSGAVGTRWISLAALFVTSFLRVGAIVAGWNWVQWLTPPGWKDLFEPYTADRFLLAIPAVLVMLAFAASAWRLYLRRGFHGACLKSANRSGFRPQAAGVFSLTLQLGRRRLFGRLVDVVATVVLTGSMAGSLVTLTKKNADYSDLFSEISGDGEVMSQTASIFSVIVDIVIVYESASAISLLAETEKRGILDAELANGISRSRVAAAHAVMDAVEPAILTAVDAVTLAVAVDLSLNWKHGREIAWKTVTQWPACVCPVGVGCLFYALSRKLTAGVWALVGWSFTLSWFGKLLELSEWVSETTLLGWLFSPSDTEHLPQTLGLLATGPVMSTLVTAACRRRDILAS